jgi:hypothetical protein
MTTKTFSRKVKVDEPEVPAREPGFTTTKTFALIRPTPRIIELGGKTFDVSIVPADVGILIADVLITKGSFNSSDMVMACVALLNRQDPSVTREWFMSPEVNDAGSIIDVCNYILAPTMKSFRDRGEKSGN